MKFRCQLMMLLLGTNFLVACTPNLSQDHYKSEHVGRAQQVSYGKIVRKMPVKISAHHEDTGVTVGATAGATLGSALGDNTRANIIGGLGGALLGGITGDAIGKRTGIQEGVRYIVKLDRNSDLISIVQIANPDFKIGQRVMLLTGGGIRDRIIAA